MNKRKTQKAVDFQDYLGDQDDSEAHMVNLHTTMEYKLKM